ncbi:MAG: gliding motility-associated C-terminal domain-containing protein, partial [Saprospiraceae bacterium]|nr:gliding motility-associated C-terminal domain-containing protein [Saprospiraceae bacterium]
YAVSLEDTSGCTALAEVFLSEPPEVLVEAQPDTAYLRLGESVELEALGHFSVESYLWTPALWLDCFDCAEVWATPLESTIYEVSVATADGCTDSDRVVVIVEKPEDVYIPNAFSPNDDGYNDRFTVFAGPSVVRVNYLRIYHRWGGSVFEADDLAPNDLSAGWDGRDRGSGQRLNSGVFVYLCEVEYLDGRKQLFEGDVLLVR